MSPRRIFPLFLLAVAGISCLRAEPYAGPAVALPDKITDRLPLADFRGDLPAEPPKELRLILREAVTLTDVEKQGIKGGGGVREVSVKVFGNITLQIPLQEGKFDYASSSGEIQFLGVNRISFKGPLREDPADPLKIENGHLAGNVLFSALIREPKHEQPRQAELSIRLDLEVQSEKFTYTPDPDPSIPPWRADKTQPSGNKVTGTWKTTDRRTDAVLELDGRISGPRGCLSLRPTIGTFFPVQAIDLVPGKSGLRMTAFCSQGRVDAHESQWAVKQLTTPLDLRKFNGVCLAVESSKSMAGEGWTGAAPVGVAVALRVKGDRWYSCRTVAPLLGGRREFAVDFDLFVRGAANPGVGNGPNSANHLDLSKIDAVAVGVVNPFGVGTIEFEALSLEAIRYSLRGNGEAPPDAVAVTVETDLCDEFEGKSEVPPGLFGYHLANPSFQSAEPGPEWFRKSPVDGDGMKLLELCRPGSLRPLDHTNLGGESGARMVHIFPAAIAKKGDALDGIMTTITNENLWARPRWMDSDPVVYAEGIRAMFRQVGSMGWTPDQPENTLRRIEFWNEPFMWARHINRGSSTVGAGPGDPGGNRGKKAWEDPTQFTFMPGELGGRIYSQFFNAAAEGLRETNRYMKIGGCSSGSFGDDFCSMLTNYVDHFLQGSTDKIDFLTEHHYNGNPARFAADYEIVTAWSLAKYGKSWPVWNTEANDLDDVAPGDARSAEAAQAITDRNRAFYNYRDILEMILRSRDVAAGRAIHALWGRGWFKNEGEYLMFRHTAALRGKLLVSSASDPAIIPLATWEDGHLTLCLLNDSPFERTVQASFRGLAALRDARVTGLRLNPANALFEIVSHPAKASNDTLVISEPILPFEIVKIEIPEAPQPVKVRASHRFFADVTVANVLPGHPVAGKIRLSRERLEKASSALLRVIFRDVQTGEAGVSIGPENVRIPATTSDEGQHRVVDIPLSATPAALAKACQDGALPIRLDCGAGTDGFTAYALAIILCDSPQEKP